MLNKPLPEEAEKMFDRIEARLQEIGLTVQELQAKLKIQSQHWNNWKRRRIPPARYADIAKILGKSVEWLTTGKEIPRQDLENNNFRRLMTDAVGKAPVIRMGNAKAWCDNTLDNLEITEYRSCPTEGGPRTFAAIVEGNQMVSPQMGQRSYLEGSIIFVDPDAEVQSGKRVIALIPGTHHEIFREYRREGGINYLIPYNPQYKTIETEENITFLGVVISHLMPE